MCLATPALGSAQQLDYPTTTLYRTTQITLMVDILRKAIQQARPDEFAQLIAADFREEASEGHGPVVGREAARGVLQQLAALADTRLLPVQANAEDIPPFADFQLRRRGTAADIQIQERVVILRYRAWFAWNQGIAVRPVQFRFELRDGRWQLTKTTGFFRFLKDAAAQMGSRP